MIGFGDTLDDALADLLGESTGEPSTGEPSTGPEPGSEPGAGENELQAALEDAQDALAAREQALRDGDLEAFAAADADLQDAIERAIAAEGLAGGTGTDAGNG